MGLMKAISGAIRSELADQWKEFIYCDSMAANVLMTKGVRKNDTTRFGSSNTKGSENIITKGSVIAVNEGQAMLIVEQGKIIDFTCEAGAYTFDSSTEPSMFAGSFGEGLRDTFRAIGARFTFGGDTGRDQRVYYINTKEILGNKFGSAQPMPYDDPYYRTVLYIRYFGMFSFRVMDPLIFYTSIAGNVTGQYNSEMLMEQCRSEFLTALDSALNRCGAEGVKFSMLPSKQREIAAYLNTALDEEWHRARGIEVCAVSLEKVTPDDTSRARIEDFDNAMMLGGNPSAMQGRMTSAQAAMFENMGKQSGGVGGGDMMSAVMGMMGVNMMNQMANNQQPIQPQQPAAAIQPQPAAPAQPQGWTCKCGTENTGKFCCECGARRPLYQCDKCGWKPADPSNPPKFCPECGDRFDEGDLQ